MTAAAHDLAISHAVKDAAELAERAFPSGHGFRVSLGPATAGVVATLNHIDGRGQVDSPDFTGDSVLGAIEALTGWIDEQVTLRRAG